MERDLSYINARILEVNEELGRKVEARRWCRHSPRTICPDGLIVVLAGNRILGVSDVRRQGHLAILMQTLPKVAIARPVKAQDSTTSRRIPVNHLSTKALTKVDHAAFRQPLTGLN